MNLNEDEEDQKNISDKNINIKDNDQNNSSPKENLEDDMLRFPSAMLFHISVKPLRNELCCLAILLFFPFGDIYFYDFIIDLQPNFSSMFFVCHNHYLLFTTYHI